MKEREHQIRSGGRYLKGITRDGGMVILLVLSSVLLFWGMMMLYLKWNWLIGGFLVLVGFILISCIRYFVKSEEATT
jgi:hypothetical protein